MIKLGIRQTLTIVKKVDFGVYLEDTTDNDHSEENRVLLPKKDVPADADVMDPIDVFVYRDSGDRLIATTKDPLIHLGECATLTVKEVGNIGAFLDWGLEKDLFLPFKEQKGRPSVGESVAVSLYVDKSNRLCSTMWISKEDKKQGDYEKNARVLLGILKRNKGYLSLTDKSTPEEIRETVNMSKNEFKKAVGNLYKQRLISLEDNGIRLK